MWRGEYHTVIIMKCNGKVWGVWVHGRVLLEDVWGLLRVYLSLNLIAAPGCISYCAYPCLRVWWFGGLNSLDGRKFTIWQLELIDNEFHVCQMLKLIPLLRSYKTTRFDPAILILVMYQRERKCASIQELIHIHSSIIHISPKVETTKYPSTSGWKNKMWNSSPCGILFIDEKEWRTDPCYNFYEWSQTQNTICSMIPFMWNVQKRWI